MHPRPLPAPLATGPFSRSEAVSAGVPVSRLRRGDLVRPARGVRALMEPVNVVEQALAVAKALTAESAFSHVTAARLHGLPLPAPLEADTRLHVITQTSHGQVRRPDVVGHRGLSCRQIDVVDGVRVTSPADTWVDLGQLVRSHRLTTDDLVMVGDAVVARASSDWREHGWGSSSAIDASGGAVVPGLARALELRIRPRGKRLLARALPLIRPGVRSPMESYARLMFVSAGFPEPAVNQAVYFADGGWLLEGDLVWEEQRLIAEYQGAHHADRRQLSVDRSRRNLAEDEGWRMLEIFAEDVFQAHRRAVLLRRAAVLLGIDPANLALW